MPLNPNQVLKLKKELSAIELEQLKLQFVDFFESVLISA